MAALEIQEQIERLGLDLEKVTIVTACGTGGTLAGLMAGFALLGSPVNLLGIDVGKLWKAFPASIAILGDSRAACTQLLDALGNKHINTAKQDTSAELETVRARQTEDYTQVERQHIRLLDILRDELSDDKRYDKYQ